MSTEQSYKDTLEQLQKALAKRDGLLKPAGYSCNRKHMLKGQFDIGSNDELLFTISCLLKTCVLALEGDASFSLTTLSKAETTSSVIVSLEFIIGLLPREQMVAMDDLSEILSKEGL